MPIPLSQLMTADDPDVGALQGSYTMCLAPKLFEQLEAATARYTDLEAKIEAARERAGDPDRAAGPRKRVGHKSDLRALEAEAEQAAEEADAIRSRMEERSVILHLVAKEDEFRGFATEHPARELEKDPTGSKRDRMYAAGQCNIDALLDILPTFITRYGDEQPTDQMWAYIRANSAPGDRDSLASKVVQMHTRGVDLGKSRLALRTSRRSATGSE